MARLYSIEIENFRGIAKLSHIFGKENLYCFIGQGDSGKSTILDAIYYVLSPVWNESFNDGDFYKCDVSKPLRIRATLIDIPTEVASDGRYYEYLKSYNPADHVVSDELDVNIPDGELREHAITIELEVTKELEPTWKVICSRHEEGKAISHGDRKKLNVFVVSDSVDRHFQWTKWNPLYSLHSQSSPNELDESNVVLEVLRNAKGQLDSNQFDRFSETMNQVVELAKRFGMDLPQTRTTIDFRDIVVKDGRFSLHDDVLPFRVKGKGSKRLISMAIQSALCKDGGIMLIDEFEQSLESFRVKHAVATLKEQGRAQLFLTTHSHHVLEELGAPSLLLVKRNCESLGIFSPDCNGLIRSNPQTFFHKRILVCEGKTEIGVCRAIDSWLRANKGSSLALKEIGIVLGGGNELVNHCKALAAGEFETLLLCDSDEKVTNDIKVTLEKLGIEIADFDDGQSIEDAAIEALDEDGIKELLGLACRLKAQKEGIDLKEARERTWNSVKSRTAQGADDSVLSSAGMKTAIALTAKEKKWFKTVEGGEEFGRLLLKKIDLNGNSSVARVLNRLIQWIQKSNE
ncbi:MAG: AAA family ATPase [Pyrinomonadaceae bacterium]